MKYRGFNQRELNRITEILEKHSVVFEVSVPDESLEYINDKTKRVNHRFMDNLLQIEIDKAEFDKIPANDIAKLFDLRVYKEEESPFTDEELNSIPEEVKPSAPKPDKHAGMNQWAAILAIGAVVLFVCWKNGYFK
jgi:hypothetical protein